MPAYGGFDCRTLHGCSGNAKRAALDSPYSLSFSRGRTSQKQPELLRAYACAGCRQFGRLPGALQRLRIAPVVRGIDFNPDPCWPGTIWKTLGRDGQFAGITVRQNRGGHDFDTGVSEGV
jgi:hypothetical protein